MIIEIKRESGLIFAVESADIKEIGEHETGGAYIVFVDGSSLLLEQDYKTVKEVLASTNRFDHNFVSTDFTLMSKQRYKNLKKRVKRVKTAEHS